MNKRTARRLAAATAFTVPGAICGAGAAQAGATFLTPRANTAVGGKSVTIYAQFTAPRPVASVKMFLDDTLVDQRTFNPGGMIGSVNFAWDSTTASSGAHQVTLKMYDRAGRVVGMQSLPVSVVNGSGVDTVPPQVTIIAPSPNAAMHGTFDVKVLATDNSREAPYVSLFVDKDLRSVSNRQPYSVAVDTTQYDNGTHVLEAWAYDGAGNKGTAAAVPFRVNNVGGATTLNPEVNAALPATDVEAPASTEATLVTVPSPKSAITTAPTHLTPSVTRSAAKPALAKPATAKAAPKPAASKPVGKAEPVLAPKALVAAVPLPPQIETVLEAAPEAPPALVTDSDIIRELPVEGVEPAETAAPAPKEESKPTPKVNKPVARKPAPPVTADAAPTFVLKMQGDKVIVPAPVAKPVTAKRAPKPKKTLLARALHLEVGNPAPVPSRISSTPRATAPVLRGQSNPAPRKVGAVAAPTHAALRPVIVPELPADRVHKGRILHAARAGETPAHIARQYGVPVKRLLAANHLGRRGQFRIGSLVSVPSPVRVAFNDATVQFDVAPRIQNGVTTAALRQICEAAGGQVEWDATTREVRATGAGAEIVLRIGSRFATVNGTRVALDVPTGIHGGRALVPVRFLTDALKLHAEYDLRSGEISLHRL